MTSAFLLQRLISCVLLIIAPGASFSSKVEARLPEDRFPDSLRQRSSTASIDNGYFPLLFLVHQEYLELSGQDTTYVTMQIHPRLDTLCNVVCSGLHERVVRRGQLIEESIEWFAQDADGGVWLFGEHRRELRGDNVFQGGSWEAGQKEAIEGRYLPSHPALTPPFRRSFARHRSEEMAQVLLTKDTVTVPAGHFDNCLRVREWSMLESGHSVSWYAPGIGLVKSVSTDGDTLVCVSIRQRTGDKALPSEKRK